jgi:hypothetical protein
MVKTKFVDVLWQVQNIGGRPLEFFSHKMIEAQMKECKKKKCGTH